MTILDRFKSLLARLEGAALDGGLPPGYPCLAVEIAPDRVTGVRVELDRKGGAPRLKAVETRALPEGAIEPSLLRPNILAPQPVAAALEAVLSRLGEGEGRLSLLLPDQVARVAILPFPALPRTRGELVELVRFRLAKSLPFKAEEAAFDLMILGGAGGPGPAGGSVLAAFAQRTVIEQYEGLCAALGYWPGLVGLATFELFNLCRGRLAAATRERDALLLNVSTHDVTMLILRGEEVLFYRCKPLPAAPGDAGVTAALRREIYTSLAFYQEKLLGRGLGRVWLRAAVPEAAAVREAVLAETGATVEVLDLREILPAGPELALDPGVAVLALPAAGAAAGRRP